MPPPVLPPNLGPNGQPLKVTGPPTAPDGGPPQSAWEKWIGDRLHAVPMPAGGVPGGALGAPADTSGDACAAKYCLPLGHCGCWSDVWVFGTGLTLIGVGLLLVVRGGGK